MRAKALLVVLLTNAAAIRPPPRAPVKRAVTTRVKGVTQRKPGELAVADVRGRLAAMTELFDAFASERLKPFVTEDVDAKKIGSQIRFYLRIIAVSFLVRWFVVEPRYIESSSMAPTFRPGDQIAIEKISTYARRPRPGEVILFRPPVKALEIERRNEVERALRRGARTPPPDRTPERRRDVFVKRVVAGPGDVVEVRDRQVLVNGVPLEDTFASTAPQYAYGPETVPPGCLFVLGDNRNRSFDSHSWGPLPARNVVGHVILRYWPLERFGQVEH